ncbi:MAG: hypothetical protein IPH48_15935 [bacterium]|nr:hypothetical protein [bacterium]
MAGRPGHGPARTRFTFATGDEVRACWSRDSATVYYESREAGTYRIMQQPVEGQGGEAIVPESTREISPTDASLDGSTPAVRCRNRGRPHRDAPPAPGRRRSATPVTVAGQAKRTWRRQVFAGRPLIVYHTQTSAGWDVFVMPATGGARKWQVTSEGAVYPHWNKSGTELWVSRFNGDL